MAQDDANTPTFDDYKWEEDDEWQVLIKKLEFPPTFHENKKEKYILKRKQKYFKQKIDPNFKPTYTTPKPSEPTSDPSEPASNLNESNPHDPSNQNQNQSASNTSSSPSQSQPESQPESKPKPKPKPKPQTRPQQSSYNRSRPYQPPPTAIGRMLSPFLNYFYLIAQWFVFSSCLLSLIIPKFYYYALYAVILMHIVCCIQNNGQPRMAMWYAQRLMQDENVMIAVYGLIFLMGNPVFVFISPIILRSFYMGVFLLSGALSVHLPSVRNGALKPLFSRVLHATAWFNQTVAMLEVLVGIFLIFACFFMSKTVILTFIYWQIMHARYMMSKMIQHAFATINIKITSLLSKIPFLLNLYNKMTGLLWNMVDPQKIQQQQQAAGGAAGGIAGMMKKCTIM